ncbi:hypothetical protein SLEP1_g34728 [Rubroshorea leprosula]|uniref:Uncharacterized protein n=1 Tax=Rubroshorea leprosula TaxID=152421 RepID=A0AAV5KKY8_9ROSI|nr:hypothetical protein SLEP1_g34728 [Rubroshorea leprosula]
MSRSHVSEGQFTSKIVHFIFKFIYSPNIPFGSVVTNTKANTTLYWVLVGAARTQAPAATNYDVGSPTWGDLRRVHLLSAMEATHLGHGPSWSPIDPVQLFLTFLPYSF